MICTFPAAHLDIEDYPAVKQYFINADWSNEVPHGCGQLKLEQTGRSHNVNGAKFKSRKKTGNKWFETQDQIAYMDDFAKQKIVFSRISGNSPCFAMDKSGMLTNDTGYIITGKGLPYLLSQLTSREIWYVFKRFYMGGGIEREFKVNNLQTLRVPPANQAIPFTEREINFISSSVKA